MTESERERRAAQREASLAEKRYLTASQLRERYGNVSHMWVERRLKNDADFPRPLKVGSSLIRMWDLDEIEAYERVCARQPAKQKHCATR